MAAESLLDFVRRYAGLGDQVAVRQRRGYRMESWTYRRVAAEAHRVAHELAERGVRQGDSILLWGDNSAEWIAAFLGCLLAGVVIVPIDHASSKDFAARVAREVEAKLIFGSHGNEPFPALPFIALERLSAAIAGRDAACFPCPHLS